MVHLSRIAEDFILMTSEEFGFFELADSSATGSSMMPQKKNPDPLELVRGKAGRAIGHLTGLLVTMKGLPTGYNKDLQEDKEPLFDAEDTLAVSLDATAAVVRNLTLHPERTDGGVRPAARDRRRGLPGVARRAVPSGARNGRRDGSRAAGRETRLRSAVARRMARFSEHFGDDVKEHVTPEASVGRGKRPNRRIPTPFARSRKRETGLPGARPLICSACPAPWVLDPLALPALKKPRPSGTLRPMDHG